MIRILVVLLFLFNFSLSAESEVVNLKQTTTKYNMFISETEETELMPGNDKFGFFYRPGNNAQGICRIRIQILCDHGLEFYKKIVNTEAVLLVQSKMYSVKSDHNGVLDFLFRCPKGWKNEKANLSFGKYQSDFVVHEVPAKHRVPAGKCK